MQIIAVLCSVLFCWTALSPESASGASTAGSAPLLPCSGMFTVTTIDGDPKHVAARFLEPAGPFTGGIVAYGRDRTWTGIVERTLLFENRTLHEYSVELRADGAIEGVSFTPSWAACTFSAGSRPPTANEALATQRPALTLGNPQPVEPMACTQPYAPPTVLRAITPDTPPIAQQQGIVGAVHLGLAVDERGVPQAARIISSPSAILNGPALAAALRTEFKPSVFRCKQVPSAYFMTIEFSH